MGTPSNITPMLAQYLEMKRQHPDSILFYRMGDFYEAFDDDVKLIAELLSVTLTWKEFATKKGSKERVKAPMAGMPYHAIERQGAWHVMGDTRAPAPDGVGAKAFQWDGWSLYWNGWPVSWFQRHYPYFFHPLRRA